MRKAVEVFYTADVKCRRVADCAVHFISFLKKKFCKVRAVLAGDASRRTLYFISGSYGRTRDIVLRVE
jgi:hypothetical protein